MKKCASIDSRIRHSLLPRKVTLDNTQPQRESLSEIVNSILNSVMVTL